MASNLPPRRPGRPTAPPGGHTERRPAKKSSNPLTIVLIVAAVCLFVLCAGGGLLVALLFPAVNAARNAARYSLGTNNLKQVGLAVYNFHDAYNRFPPATGDAEKDRNTSWQTALLPYLGASGGTYDRIDRTQPWDAPANAEAYRTAIPEFLIPVYEQTHDDRGFGLSHFAGNSQVIGTDPSLAVGDVTDGTSNTILAGQVADGFDAWGDPEALRDPADGLGGGPTAFGGKDGRVLILMLDGSVRMVNADEVSPDILKGLATPAGGEQVAF